MLTDASRELTNAQHFHYVASDERDNAIREAIDAGITYRTIAEVTGLSQGRIGQIKKDSR